MPTESEIEVQLKKLDNYSYFSGRRELKELPRLMWEDETVEKLVQGVLVQGVYQKKKGGILVATNKRLLFVDKTLLFGLSVEYFPYNKINPIQCQPGWFSAKIIIFSSGNRAEILIMEKKHAQPFCDYVRARTTSVSEHASNKNSNNSTDKISLLEKLAKLKENGILTDEEFKQEKEKILKENS